MGEYRVRSDKFKYLKVKKSVDGYLSDNYIEFYNNTNP